MDEVQFTTDSIQLNLALANKYLRLQKFQLAAHYLQEAREELNELRKTFHQISTLDRQEFKEVY